MIMKRNQIILLSIFLLITGLIFVRVSSNKKTPIKEIKSGKTILYVPVGNVQNSARDLQLISYGQVAPATELEISFEVQGKLEKGDLVMKPGVKFKSNQLLYKVNQEEAFYSLSSRKSQLSNLVIAAMADIEMDFPSEKTKWTAFLENLSPEKRLADLPAFRSTKERMFITSKGIATEYYSIKSLEARMEKYFYLAPFNGTVVEVYAEPGAIANPGGRIAKIAKTGEMEVKVPISLSTIKKFQQEGLATFTDGTGRLVGKGKIIRVSDVINQRTQSVDVYYSIQAEKAELIFNGQFVSAAINQSAVIESYAVPRLAVKENKVKILVKDKLVQREVVIVGNKPDTLFISGLKNGDQLVLEQIEASTEVKVYKGIKR